MQFLVQYLNMQENYSCLSFFTASKAVYLLQFAVPVLIGTVIAISIEVLPLENTVLGCFY